MFDNHGTECSHCKHYVRSNVASVFSRCARLPTTIERDSSPSAFYITALHFECQGRFFESAYLGHKAEPLWRWLFINIGIIGGEW